MRRVWALAARVVAGALAVLSLTTCNWGQVGDVVWETVDDVRVMVIDFVSDLPLERLEDVADSAALLVRPLQSAAENVYLGIRGADLELAGEPAGGSYSLVIWEDRNRNGEVDEGEPFRADTNGNQGFTLDRSTSLVGSFSMVSGTDEVSYTTYPITATYTVTGGPTSYTLAVTAEIPGATEVLFHHNQAGWLPGFAMTRSGDTFSATITGLEAGPLAFKYEIDGEVTWFPDHNEFG